MDTQNMFLFMQPASIIFVEASDIFIEISLCSLVFQRMVYFS